MTKAPLSFLLLPVLMLCIPASADPELQYFKPSAGIVDIAERPYLPIYNIDPTKRWLMRLDPVGMAPMELLAREELHLAGLRIRKESRARSRRLFANAMAVVNVSTGEERKISGFPNNPIIQYVLWSPNGEHIGVLVEREFQVELWLVSLETATAARLSELPVNSGMDDLIAWSSDSQSIWVKTAPHDQGPPPMAPTVSTGVLVRETTGEPVPAQTHQGVLQTRFDVEQFEYYFSSRITQVMLNGTHRFLGDSGIYRYVRPSPDNRYLLVERLSKPWSYFVQEDQFAYDLEVLNLETGEANLVASAPLAEALPYSGGWVRKGARNFAWRSDAPSTVVWVEALDGGNSYQSFKYRDRIMSLTAPFHGEPRQLAVFKDRVGDVVWNRNDRAIVITWDWVGREIAFSAINPEVPGEEPRQLLAFQMGDRYRHPGMPIITYNDLGFPVLQTDKTGQLMYLLGEGGSVSGDRPFLDSFHMDTRRKKRLFRSRKPHYEHPVAFLDSENLEMVVQRESRNEPPNYFRWNPGDKFHRRLTFNQNPFPELVEVQLKLLKYKRRDGLNLTANLYLPAGYDVKKDGPLPTLVWAYPRAYLNAGNASQVKKSPYEFMEAKWNRPLLWVTRGYAIVDDPAMPILAAARGNPNDTFVPQLVESGHALVQELIRLGVSEPGKIGLGGHSYGAFMTANLLAHSDLFCAGIARSGAYNRTLTPFGFQSEERSLWDAMGAYLAMSPFLSANKINEPLLLLHGAMDENAGTYLLQSERLFHAINGLGGQARLVMFPNEGHTLRGEDSILHMLWEIEQWLDLKVRKQPQPSPWLITGDESGPVSSNPASGSGAEEEPE